MIAHDSAAFAAVFQVGRFGRLGHRTRLAKRERFGFGSELLLSWQRFGKGMEILTRTHRASRPGGAVVVVNEYWQMVDHSALRNGTDCLPGPKRFALETGEVLRRVDEYTFQVVRTGEILRAHQLTQ